MRKINKDSEPESLRQWKRRHPHGHYDQLDKETRRALRQSLLTEQFYLCAYCCQKIADIDECHNEHLLPRGTHAQNSLDYQNLIASCNTPQQCGDAHGHQALALTPLMDACETELQFMLSGRVQGRTQRAEDCINTLNLGHKALIEKRKQLVAALLWENGCEPEPTDDAELLNMLIDDISQPENGKLAAYAPVVCKILRGWL